MIEQNRDLPLILGNRPVDNGFIFPKLFPKYKISQKSYSYTTTYDDPLVPTMTSFEFISGSTPAPIIRGLETPITGALKTYRIRSMIPYNQVKELEARGELSARQAQELLENQTYLDRGFEKAAFDLVDATTTNLVTTSYKWNNASATSELILTEYITAIAAFRVAAGVYPNLCFGPVDGMNFLKKGLALLSANAGVSDIAKLPGDIIPAVMNVQLLNATAMYKASVTTTTYADIWSTKNLYLAYTADQISDTTAKKAYGFKPEMGDTWEVTETTDPETKEFITNAFTTTALVVIDSTCIGRMRGPSGGSYELW